MKKLAILFVLIAMLITTGTSWGETIWGTTTVELSNDILTALSADNELNGKYTINGGKMWYNDGITVSADDGRSANLISGDTTTNTIEIDENGATIGVAGSKILKLGDGIGATGNFPLTVATGENPTLSVDVVNGNSGGILIFNGTSPAGLSIDIKTGTVSLDAAGKISGKTFLSGGTLNVTGLAGTNNIMNFEMSSGTLTRTAKGFTSGDITVKGSTLSLYNGDVATGRTLTISGGAVTFVSKDVLAATALIALSGSPDLKIGTDGLQLPAGSTLNLGPLATGAKITFGEWKPLSVDNYARPNSKIALVFPEPAATRTSFDAIIIANTTAKAGISSADFSISLSGWVLSDDKTKGILSIVKTVTPVTPNTLVASYDKTKFPATISVDHTMTFAVTWTRSGDAYSTRTVSIDRNTGSGDTAQMSLTGDTVTVKGVKSGDASITLRAVSTVSPTTISGDSPTLTFKIVDNPIVQPTFYGAFNDNEASVPVNGDSLPRTIKWYYQTKEISADKVSVDAPSYDSTYVNVEYHYNADYPDDDYYVVWGKSPTLYGFRTEAKVRGTLKSNPALSSDVVLKIEVTPPSGPTPVNADPVTDVEEFPSGVWDWLTTNENGQVVLDEDGLKILLKNSGYNLDYASYEVRVLPALRATVDVEANEPFTFIVSDIGSISDKDRFAKIDKAGKVHVFSIAEDPTEKEGQSSFDVTYGILGYTVKEGGKFDFDNYSDSILDPGFLFNPQRKDGPGGGGCSATYAPFALLLAVPFLLRKRK